MNFTQSQAHGLQWDNEIRTKVFGLPSCKNDTTKYDVITNDENISIKTSCNKKIDCGDILRFHALDKDKPTTILLIRYKQSSPTQKRINEIVEINYTEDLHKFLFGSITREILMEYVEMIKAIPHGIVSAEIKASYKQRKNELQKKHDMRINISPKVDSKGQRRVQCSIPKIDTLTVMSRTNESVVRGVEITQTIESTPRQRRNNVIKHVTMD